MLIQERDFQRMAQAAAAYKVPPPAPPAIRAQLGPVGNAMPMNVLQVVTSLDVHRMLQKYTNS